MQQSKFKHMAEKEHYKMYKAGKTWLFASIVALSFGAAITASITKPVKADTTSEADEESTSSNSTTGQNSAVIQSSSTANSADSFAKSVQSDNTQTNKTVGNNDVSTPVTKDDNGSSNSSSLDSSKKTSAASQINQKQDETQATSVSTAKSATKASLSSAQSKSQGLTDSDNVESASTKVRARSVNTVSATSADVKASSEASVQSRGNSIQGAVDAMPTATVVSNVNLNSTSQVSQSVGLSTGWTDTKTPVTNDKSEDSQVAEISTTAVVTTSSSQAPVTMSQMLSVSPVEQTMQKVSLIDPNKFVIGSKVTFSQDGTLVVNLPAGVSAFDIHNTQLLVESMGIKNVQINAVSDAVNTDITTGETTALSDLSNGFWSGAGSTSGYDISDWIGTSVGTPDFTAAYNSLQNIQSETNQTTQTADLQNLDNTVKKSISDWVSKFVSKIDWNYVSSSVAYKAILTLGGGISSPTPEIQNGYAEAIKNFVQGELSAEAYYLWLIKSTSNTDNSLYYGTQGYNDSGKDAQGNSVIHFAQLLNALNGFTTDSSTDINLKNAYKAGNASILAWITGDQNEINVIKDTLGTDSTDGPFDTNTSGTVLLSEISSAALGHAATSKTAPTNIQYAVSSTGIDKSTFISFTEVNHAFKTDTNFAGSIQDQVNGTSTKGLKNLTDLETTLADATLHAYYNEWENIVNKAFKNATVDALSGQSIALNYSEKTVSKLSIPEEYKATAAQSKIYLTAYQAAKSYLSGFETTNGMDGFKYGIGNTPITNTDLTNANNVHSPLDLAIYNVLTGNNTFVYNTAKNGVNSENGAVKDAVIGTNFQSIGYSDTNADWIATAAQNDMYQLALNVANQAKTDFLSDIQLAVNSGDLSKLDSATQFLPSAGGAGVLSANQYAYYQKNSYVYYKVFSALYKSYFTNADGTSNNIIQNAIEAADAYVKKSGDENHGQPKAQSLADAETSAPGLKATTNGNDITLNGDVTYTAPYSETNSVVDGKTVSTPVTGVTTVTPTAATTIKSTDIDADASDNAQKTIQNAINYAYVHEESIAIPAYEAGYAAVQKNLLVTPADTSATLNPLTTDQYQFENKSTVSDVLTPVLTTTNPDGSTVWTINYNNADGTSTVVTINRDVNTAAPQLGTVSGIEVVVNDETGTPLSDSGVVTPNKTGVTATYHSIQLGSNMDYDATTNPSVTTVTVVDKGDGTFDYTFVRDAQTQVKTQVDGNKTTFDGTKSNDVYQAGYDYRKSFISEITLRQQAADKQFKSDVTGDNSLTKPQIYAGFFQNNDVAGNLITGTDAVGNKSLQIDPVTDVNGKYGTFPTKTITNIDGSKVDITLNTNGDVTYTVYDVNGKTSSPKATGTLNASQTFVPVTNTDKTDSDLSSSYVTISRSTNAKDAITIEEHGVQAKMVNDLNVVNDGTTATASVSMGKNVEPSMTTTTIVTPVSVLHQGVLFSADPSYGPDGIQSVYDTIKGPDGKTPLANPNGLVYQGKANGTTADTATTPATPAYYGESENTTTTIQYIATNATNNGTGSTATVDLSTETPTVTVKLGTYQKTGEIASSTSFDASGVTDENTGTEVFEWLKTDGTLSVKNLPADWTYDAQKQTLTHTLTADEKTALLDGKYTVNWSSGSSAKSTDKAATDATATNSTTAASTSTVAKATAPALLDQYNDVMNVNVTAPIVLQASLTQDINTSTDAVDTANTHVFSKADIENAIVKATGKTDPTGLVEQFISKWAGTYTTATGMNGMPLADGVKSVTLNTDGSVAVTFDPTAATANYKDGKNTISLDLPFTVNDQKHYVTADPTDATDKTPLADLTLNMNMQANVKVAYQAMTGGTDTSVKDTNDKDTNVTYVATGTDLQKAYTETAAVLGSTYTPTNGVPATLAASDTTNYNNATYKLVNGVATNDPSAVDLTSTQLKFGDNDKTYLYAKTYAQVDQVTSVVPTVKDDTTSVAAGVIETIDLSQAAAGFDWDSVAFTPDANTAASYNVAVVVNKTDKTLTVTYTPKNAASNLDFLQDTYQNGFAVNGWLTDTKTVTGSTTPALNNAMYVITKSAPLNLANYPKTATIDVASTNNGYDADAHTYTFDVPSSALSTKEITALSGDNKLVLTAGSSLTDKLKGYKEVNSVNWASVKSMAISLNGDGTAHVVATLDTSSTPVNSLQNGAILVAGAATDSPVDSGIYLALTLNNDLKQDSTGLPAGITKPVYADINNKALHDSDSVTAQAVAGYNVTGATYDGTAVAASDLTLNADGTATYSAQHGWGSNTGATVADKLVWDYTPAPIAATIGSQEKFYGMADPTTYAVSGLSAWLKAPENGWVAADFTRTHADGNTDDTKDPVGEYVVTLSATGIADLQAANPNYTITDAKGKSTIDKVAAGKLTINAAPIKSAGPTASRVFNGSTMTADPKGAKTGKDYVPELTFTATDPSKSTATPETFTLDKADYTYTDANGQTIDPDTTKAVGTYTWTLNDKGQQDLDTKLGNKDGLDQNLNFLLDATSVETGSFEITADPIDVTVNNGKRDYNGKDVGTDHSSTDSKDFTSISFANQGTDTTKLPDAVSLNPQTDFTYKNDKGDVVAYSEVKNAGTYTWTVNDAGKTAIATQLGEVKDATGKVTQAANYSIDDSKLTGTYTINKKAVTVTLSSATYQYDGKEHSVTNPDTTIATGVTGEAVAITLTGDKRTNVGSNAVTGKATDASITAVNANYDVTVVDKGITITITADPITVSAQDGERNYDGKTIVDTSNAYQPTLSFTLADGDKSPKPADIQLTASDYDYTDAAGKPANDAKNVGTYTWKVNATGLAKIYGKLGQQVDGNGKVTQAANYSIDESKLTGKYVIDKKPVTVALQDKSFVYDGAAHKLVEPDTETATGVTGEKVIVNYDNNSRTDIGETDVTGEATDATDAPVNSNYKITVTGAKLTVTGLPVVVKTNNGERAYDAKAVGSDHSSTNSKDFTKIVLANKGTDKTTLPDLDPLDAATDFDYTDSAGKAVQPSDVKNAGTYNWKVNAAGLVKLYKALGSETGVATDANYTIDSSLLNGTYTIDKVDKTVSLDKIDAQYTGQAETITATTAELATGIGDEHVDVTLTNATRTSVGHNDVTGAATANIAMNDNYNITVTPSTIDITDAPLTLKTIDGSRAYDGQNFTANHNNGASAYAPTITFALSGKDNKAPLPETVTLAYTDLTFAKDVKNAGEYTWTVNDAGKAKIAAQLGEVKDATGKVTQVANYSIDDSKLTGTYTIDKVDKTFALTAANAVYDGAKHSVVIPTDMSTGIGDEKAVIKLANSDQTLVGSHSVTGNATDDAVNDNYNITVTPADVTVTADALTPTYSTGTKTYDGKTVSDSYTPAITFASTDTTNHVTVPTVTLVPADYTYSFVSADGKTTTSSVDPTTVKNVGTYTWKLTDAGIADVKKQVGTNFDVGDLSAKTGTYTITAKSVTVALTAKSFTYDGTAHALDEPDTATATGVTGEKVIVNYDNNSRTANGETDVTGEATADAVNSNYTITVTGAKLTVTGLPVVVKTNNGERAYDAKAVGSDHSSTDSKDFTKIVLANKGTDKTTLPDLDPLDAATDFDYTDSTTGKAVQPSDVKNAGTYNWKVNAAGLSKLYKALGSETGVVTDANFTIDSGLLIGTYTIDKVDKTVSLDKIDAQYTGQAETIAPTTAELVTGIGDEHVDVTLTNASRTLVGHNDVTGTATANVAVNDNYKITVTPSTIDISAAPLSVTTNPATRVYDGNDFNTNHKNGDDTYTPTITFALSGKDNKAPLPAAVPLDYTDLDFSKDVKDVGDYTWTVKPSGLTKIYKALGSKTGVSTEANYSVTASELTGTYSITPASITIAAPSLSKIYDGNAYTDSDDVATVTGKPTNGTTPTYSLTDLSGDKNAGTYPITVTAEKTDNPDYTITVTASSLLIKPKPVTFALKDTSFVYDGTQHTMPMPADLSTGVDDQKAVLTLTNANQTEVGPYTVAGSASSDPSAQSINKNYTITVTPATLTVTADPVVPTFKSDSKTYDSTQISTSFTPSITVVSKDDKNSATMPEIKLSADDYVYTTPSADGKGTVTVDPTTEANAGTYTWKLTPKGITDVQKQLTSDLDAGDLSKLSGTYTINKKPITITLTPVKVQYDGTQQSVKPTDTQLSTGINGDKVAITLTNATMIDVGKNTVTGTPTTDSAVNKNYDIKVRDTTLEVIPAPITITGPTLTKVYDGNAYVGSDDVATVTGVPAKGKSVTRSLTSIANDENVGNYPITVTANATDNPDYTITVKAGSLKITPKPIMFALKDTSFVYDSTTHTMSMPTDLSTGVGDQKAVLTLKDATQAEVGSHQVTGASSEAAIDKNYTITVTPAKITVVAAKVTPTVKSDTKTYDGQSITKTYTPTFTVGSTDPKNHVAMPTITLAAGDYSYTTTSADGKAVPVDPTTEADAGTYTWHLTAAGIANVQKQLGKNFDAGDLSKLSGTYSITPAAITIAAPSLSKTYDGNAYTGADNAAVVIGKPDNGKTPTFKLTDISDIKNAGTTVLTVSAEVNANPDYTISVKNGSLTIKPRSVTVTADSLSKNYGTKDPTLTATTSGVQGDPNSGLITGDKLAVTLIRSAGRNPGSYDITVKNGLNPNYVVTDKTGTFVIKPTVTIKYVDQNGKEIAGHPAQILTGQKIADKIKVGHPMIDDYLAFADDQAEYTVTDGTNQVVNVKYRQQASVAVNYYVKGSTNKIAESMTVKGGVGLGYSTKSATVTGYTLVSTPANATGSFVATNSDVDYYYTVNYTAVPVDNNGKQISNVPTKTGTGVPDDPINPEGGLPTIPGYTLTTTPNVPAKPGQVNVVYTPDTETVKVNYFVQGTTTSLKPSVTVSGKFGDGYETTTESVTGYHLVSTPENAKGTYVVTNSDVNYYYAADDESVKANYYIQDTTTSLKPSVTVSGKFGGDYETTTESVTGYHLISTPANANGTYAVTNSDVNHYYAPNDASVKVNYYIQDTTTSLKPSVTVAGKFGGDYMTTAESVTGYHVISTPANVKGTYAVTNSDVNYYYAPNDASVKANYYIQGTMTSLNPSVTVAGKFGESYTTSVVTVPGYALVGTPANATGKYGVDQTEVNYEYVPVTETVAANYLIKGSTTPIIKSDRLTGPFGSAYETTPAKLGGYTLVSLPSNQTGTYELTNKPVNYYYTVDYTAVPVDSNGNKISNVPTNTGTGTPGDPIDPDGGLPMIPGYTLTSTPNVPSTPGNVDVIYTPNTEDVKVNYFVQNTKTPLAANETLSGPFGSNYVTTSVTIPGYTLVETPTNATGTYGLNNADITYYYAPNVADVKVNYLIQGTVTSLAPSQTLTGIFGSNYATMAANVPGYTLVATPTNATGTYGLTETSVTYYYAPDTENVKVNYFVQGTTTSLKPSETLSGKFGSGYFTTVADVTGYYLVETPTNAKGTYAVTNGDVNYYYAPNDESVKVNYYIQGTTTSLKPSVTVTGKFGGDYMTAAESVTGYHLVSTPANTNGTYAVTNGDVNYYYAPDSDTVTSNYYIHGTTTPITDSQTLTGPFDSQYSTKAVVVKGYTLVSTPENATGMYGVTNKPVNYYYTVDYTAVPVDDNGQQIPNVLTKTGTGNPGDPIDPDGGFPTIPGYTLTTTPNVPGKPDQVNVVYMPNTETVKANYLVQDTTTSLKPSVTVSGEFGSGYTTTAADVTGYHLVSMPANAKGTYAVTNADVMYYYAPDDESVKVNYYIQDTTTSLKSSVTVVGKFGGDYTTTAETVMGYHLISMPENAKGTYAVTNGDVNYYYAPDSETVKVNYFIQGTTTSLKPSETLSGKFGSDYTTNAADITGYHLVATPTNAKGKYAVNNADVTYYYAPNDESVKVNHFVEGTTTSLKPSEMLSGKFGSDYTTNAADVTGYHLVETPTNARGTYAINNTDVTYYYVPNDASVKANYYIQGTSVSLKPSVTVAGKFGESYTTSVVTVPGYELVGTPANATGKYGVDQTEVNYEYVPVTETVAVNYLIKGSTTPIIKSDTLTGPFDSTYETTPAKFSGYTLVSLPSNQTGTYGSTNKPVNYYYTVDYTAVPVDNSGNKIPNVPTNTGTGTPGDPIDPDGGLPMIPGYTLTSTPNVPSKPGQVNVVYTPSTENVKVNYFVQDTMNALKPSETLFGKFGSDYMTTAKSVTGYHLVSTPTNANGTYAFTNNPVDYYYAPNDELVKVNYYIQGTTTLLKPSVTVTGKFGGDYTTTAELIMGYHLVSMPVNAKGMYAVTNGDVNYYYASDSETVTANYLVQGTTTSLSLSVTVSGKFGGDYMTTAESVTGYHLVSMPTNAKGTYAVTNSDVNYYYAPNDASVKVNYYVKGTTTPIKPSDMLNGLFGSKYSTEPATVEGYTSVSTPANATGTYDVTNKSVDYYYTIDYTAVPVDDNGQTIPNVPANVGTGTPGEPIDPDGGLPTIPGYTLTSTPNVPGKPGQVNVVYTPNTENVKVNYFVQDTTTSLKPSVTVAGKFGESYTTSAVSVPGYELAGTPTNATGKYGVDEANVNYDYVPMNETVAVNYFIKGRTTPIQSSDTLNGSFDTAYETAPAKVAGYTLVSLPTNQKGTYGLTNRPVNYYYTVDYTAVPVDNNGQQIPNVVTKTGTGIPGDPIDPAGGLLIIPGYTLTTTPNVPAKPGQVNVVYTPDAETVKVNYFVQGTTTSLKPSEMLSGKLGSGYTTTAELVTGYHLVSTPTNANGTYAVTNGDVNYYYAPNDASVKANYYIQGTTTSLKPSVTVAGKFGQSYMTSAASVKGYTLVSTPNNSKGVYGVTNKPVNYYYTVDYTAVSVDNNGQQIPNVPTETGTGVPDKPIDPAGGLPIIPGYTLTTTPNVLDKPGQVNVVYTPDTETVKVNYLIQGTTTSLKLSEILTGSFGSDYETNADTFMGYYLVSTPTNASSAYGLNNVDVDYYYVPDTESVQANYYVTGTTDPLLPSMTLSGPFGSKYQTTAETISGYKLVTVPTNAIGTYGLTNVAVTYYYEKAATQPTKPVTPSKPVKPVVPITPAKPVITPTQPVQPTEPVVTSTQPVQPSKPAVIVTSAKEPFITETVKTMTAKAVAKSKTLVKTTKGTSKSATKPVTLPHTGERDSTILAVIGTNLLASCLIFAAVHKYRHARELGAREDKIERKY